jgi:hypothetical protein
MDKMAGEKKANPVITGELYGGSLDVIVESILST